MGREEGNAEVCKVRGTGGAGGWGLGVVVVVGEDCDGDVVWEVEGVRGEDGGGVGEGVGEGSLDEGIRRAARGVLVLVLVLVREHGSIATAHPSFNCVTCTP